MLLDEGNFGGRGAQPGPFCPACRQPVVTGQRSRRVVFVTDPHGFKGLTGTYHLECSKPFASMADAMQMMSRPHR